ncbi:MAG: L-rhamnose mutarotase [Blastocatellia bacterium]
MTRLAFLMQLKPGQDQEYQRRHNPIWPELRDTLRDHGAHNYSIFLDPRNGQLFACVEVESIERWEQIAQTDICRKWWAHMADIMETNEDNSPQATPLPEVFHMD